MTQEEVRVLLTAQTNDFVKRFEQAAGATNAMCQKLVQLTTDMYKTQTRIFAMSAELNANQRAYKKLANATGGGTKANAEQRRELARLSQEIEKGSLNLADLKAKETALKGAVSLANDELSEQRKKIMQLPDTDKNVGVSAGTGSGILGALGGAAASLGIGKIIGDSITEGMNAVESESLFETSLGGYADSAREWSQNLGQSLGLDEYALRKNVGTLFTMTNSMGVAKDSALDMSQGLVQLAEDMASFYNMSSDEAFNKLKSGLTGEAEPLKALGILVDENTVKQYAYANGIAEMGAELSQSEKVMARYGAIMQQTSVAQGDLARTMDSPSNKLRALQNQTQTMMRDFGTTMLPTVSSLLTAASAGLTAVSPMVTALGEGINRVTTALLNLSPSAKTMLLISIGSAVAISLATKAQKLYNAANTKWEDLLTILIPKERSRAAVLKSTVGWIAILAALMAGLASIGATRREMEDGKQAENLEKEGESAAAASEGVDDLAASYENMGAGAESAKRSLADIDTLNIFGSGSASTGGIDFDAVVEGAENATDSVSGLTDGLGDIIGETESLQDELDGLNFGGLSGEGFNLMQTIKDIGLGAQTLWDAFDFDSDTQLTSLRTLNEKIKELFGEDWTNFWNGVGATLSDAFTPNVDPVKQDNALKEMQTWLEKAWDFLEVDMDKHNTKIQSGVHNLFLGVLSKAQTFVDDLGIIPEGLDGFIANVNLKIDEMLKSAQDVLQFVIDLPEHWENAWNGVGAAIYDKIYGTDTSRGGAGGRERSGSGGSRGRNRAADYEYTDYAGYYNELKQNGANNLTAGFAVGTQAVNDFVSRAWDSVAQKIELHTTVELDGRVVGESVTEYQNGENAKSNGY